MQNGESKKGIIYCRVSSLEQVDGTSLESQKRLCAEYALREGIEVLQIFMERGESAKTAARAEFIKAISFCSDKKNRTQYFIVYKIDRFSRNQTDYAIIKQKLKKYGTEIRSVSEKIDDTPSGKLMEVMLSGFAEFDNNIRTERSVNGMRERLKQGIWVWGAPIGYYRITQGANLTHDPKSAPYIRLAFDEYAKGTYTFVSLTRFLNERGFVSSNGHPAIPQLVEKIIKNPIYCGIIRVWDLDVKGAFEPLIDENLFYRCQRTGKKNINPPHLTKNPDFPLRRLVVCEFCLKPLTGSYSRGRKGIKYPYYHHHEQHCDYAKFIPKKLFENVFIDYLREINPSPAYEKAFKTILLDKFMENDKKFDEHNDHVQKEIRELEQRRQRIYELLEFGTYTSDEFMVQKDIINKKIGQMRSFLHEKNMGELDIDEALEHSFTFIRETPETWRNLEKMPEKRLRFQSLVFEKNLPFSGEKFGTAELTPIYRIYREYERDSSTLGSHVIRDWNAILIYLREFYTSMREETVDTISAP